MTHWEEPTGIAFRFTADDFVAVHRLHILEAWRARLYIMAFWLFVSAAAIGLFAHLQNLDRFICTVSVAAGVIVSHWRKFGVEDRARRAYGEYPRVRPGGVLYLLPEGLRYVSDRGNDMVLWCDLIGWHADATVLLLYIAPRLFLILPTRLTDAGLPLNSSNRHLHNTSKNWRRRRAAINVGGRCWNRFSSQPCRSAQGS